MSGEKITLSGPPDSVDCTIELTGSKSESNRALILNALSGGIVEVHNLSSAHDTVLMQRSLELAAESASSLSREQTPVLVDIGPAGTAMRFLSAYFAVSGTSAILTGTERMKQRPIGILVTALRELGARIDYTEKEGYPPLRFHTGFLQLSSVIRIKGNVSSQYLTALLLVAASMPHGLELQIEGELTSRPYVEMTLALLAECGIAHQWVGSTISIEPQEYSKAVINVEPDWSAASYWYSIAALSEKAEITLPWLKQNSLQGDSRISGIMKAFGVETSFYEGGIRITKAGQGSREDFFDLKDCPDLAQTVIVCSAALGHEATFTGLETLKIKETDRITALQNELSKIGVRLIEENELYRLDCSGLYFPPSISVATYEDHRMAMAFAPLALKVSQVVIEEPMVVAKSYPSFWDDLKKAGFGIGL